ncbi:MAG TPA: hypothetical protein VEY51_18950, partial [Chondromyces sp.]|nr:hypothetical protein [Chondromyces sp.]
MLGAMKSSKSDQERISLLLKIAKFHIFKEGEAKADLDSGWVSIIQAEQLNKVLRSPVHEGNILLLKAYYLKEKGQQDLGKASAEKAIAVLKKENDMYLLGESYAELSQHYSYKTDLDKKIGLVEQAVVCFEKAGPTERKARCYEELGDLYFHKRDKIYSQKALAALDSSLKAYQSINYPKLQGVYILYSTVYSQTADVKNGLHYALLALQTAEKLRDTSMQLCQINYIVSMTYFNLREYDKALPYQYKALSIAEKYHDINSIYLIGKNICITHLHKNDALEAQKVLDRIVEKYPQPSDVATTIDQISIRIRISEQLNQLSNLEKYCSKLASMLDSVKLSNSFMISSYHVLIKGLLKLKRYSLARHYLKKEQEFIKLVPFSARSATFYNSWFSLDTATKDYKSAVYHLLEYNKANDSIFNQAKNQQLQQIQVEYDIKSKDKNIQLLNQEKKKQELELKRSAFERKII